MQWNFPDSPSIPVSCNGGFRMPAWFDLEEIPVTASTPDDVEGFKRSIDYVHGLVDKLADAGVPPERVVLGGFSQGAATVLLAGLSYPRKLAGIVAFSGWLAMRDTFPGHVHEAQKSTPVLQVHGRADDKGESSPGLAPWTPLTRSPGATVPLCLQPFARAVSGFLPCGEVKGSFGGQWSERQVDRVCWIGARDASATALATARVPAGGIATRRLGKHCWGCGDRSSGIKGRRQLVNSKSQWRVLRAEVALVEREHDTCDGSQPAV